jgi:hypothetical protein
MNLVTTVGRNSLLLLLAAMALRAIVPVGYMPGSLGGDLLFEMCPDGMPAAIVQALGGEHHHGGGDDGSTTSSVEQCPMGHLLTPAAPPSETIEVVAQAHAPTFNAVPHIVATTATPVPYQSRAPPVIT